MSQSYTASKKEQFIDRLSQPTDVEILAAVNNDIEVFDNSNGLTKKFKSLQTLVTAQPLPLEFPSITINANGGKTNIVNPTMGADVTLKLPSRAGQVMVAQIYTDRFTIYKNDNVSTYVGSPSIGGMWFQGKNSLLLASTNVTFRVCYYTQASCNFDVYLFDEALTLYTTLNVVEASSGVYRTASISFPYSTLPAGPLVLILSCRFNSGASTDIRLFDISLRYD